MILPDHPSPSIDVDPMICGWRGRNQNKYVFNVLKHVLGYRYEFAMRDNEGWSRLITIPDEVRGNVDHLLEGYGCLDCYSLGYVTTGNLEWAAEQADIQRAVAGLVEAYTVAVVHMVGDWDHDFHDVEDWYCLIDTRGGRFVGQGVHRIRAVTAYRWGDLTFDTSKIRDADRADRAYDLCSGEAHARNRA